LPQWLHRGLTRPGCHRTPRMMLWPACSVCPTSEAKLIRRSVSLAAFDRRVHQRDPMLAPDPLLSLHCRARVGLKVGQLAFRGAGFCRGHTVAASSCVARAGAGGAAGGPPWAAGQASSPDRPAKPLADCPTLWRPALGARGPANAHGTHTRSVITRTGDALVTCFRLPGDTIRKRDSCERQQA